MSKLSVSFGHVTFVVCLLNNVVCPSEEFQGFEVSERGAPSPLFRN